MFVEELTDIDYSILSFVSKNQPVGIETIKQKFPHIDSLEYRIRLLSTPEYTQSVPIHIPIDNTYCLEEAYETIRNSCGGSTDKYLQIYSLSELGKKALQDYKIQSKRHKGEMWLKNGWIPILVTLATNLIVDGIKWLWPWILQLLSDIL